MEHEHINRFIEYCPNPCANCRHVMQKARLIVTEAQQWYRENMEITCYGDHISFQFYSGGRENKVVVQSVSGKVEVAVTEECWRTWFENLVRKLWDSFKDVLIFCMKNVSNVDKLSSIGCQIFKQLTDK